MRRPIVSVAALAAVLAVGAPAASADLASVTADECAGTAEWQVNLPLAYADMTVTSSTCKYASASVENNGNPHANVNDGTYSGGYRINLVGVNVTGTNSFAGTAVGSIGAGPIVVVSPNNLTATLVGTDPSKPAESIEEHTPAGSCGLNCYRTNIRFSTVWKNP
jgi:opacity protein-like surface antigen